MLKAFLFVCCFISMILSKELPPGIKLCNRKDPEFSNCVKECLQMSFKLFANGIPEFGIKMIEPLSVESFESKAPNPNGVFAVNQKFRNIKFTGLSGVIVKNVKATVTNDKCEIKIKSIQPYLQIDGDYEVDGKALLFNLNGHGKANITGTDVLVKTLVNCELYKKDNEEYLRLTNTKLEIIDMKSVNLDLENIFDGNKDLSKSINQVLNENGIEVIKELSSGFDKALSEAFFKIGNSFVEGIPTSKLFIK